MIQKIDLEDKEKSKIARTARINKFNFDKVLLYEKDSEKKLDVLINCFRFLYNLANNDFVDIGGTSVSIKPIGEEDEEKKEEEVSVVDISKKINEFLLNEEIIVLMNEAYQIKSNYPITEYGKQEHNYIIDQFFIKNSIQINHIIDFVYELGKKIQQYDPEETQGYY